MAVGTDQTKIAAAPDSTRLKTLPTQFDVGEQVVGTDEWFTIGVPVVIDGSAAMGVASSFVTPLASQPPSHGPLQSAQSLTSLNRSNPEPDRDAPVATEGLAFSGPALPSRINPGSAAPIAVQFSPRRVGDHQANLTFNAQWSDGVSVSHQIALHGRARRAADIPAVWAKPPSSPAPDDSPPPQEVDSKSVLAKSTFTHASEAGEAARSLAAMQTMGLDKIAEKEIRSYQRAPPESPWWMPLADIALQMATAGIATALGKAFVPRMTNYLLQNAGLQGKTASIIEAGSTDFLKEGIKNVAKRAITSATAPPKAEGSKASPQTPDSRLPLSTNPAVAFFEKQSRDLERVAKGNMQLVTDFVKTLDPYENSHPGITDEALLAVKNSFDAIGDQAEVEQAEATEMQWVAGVARASLPSTNLGDNRMVTVGQSGHWKDDGVMEIDVTTDVPYDNHSDIGGRTVRAESAKIMGVSQEVADRMWSISLAKQAIPIVFHVTGPNYRADLRRDEAGRVSISASYLSAMTATEAMSQRTANGVIDAVLGRTLSDWGVKKVETDDSSGRGDPK